jgi:hypothetical protein
VLELSAKQTWLALRLLSLCGEIPSRFIRRCFLLL